jgi:glutathione S-transferase
LRYRLIFVRPLLYTFRRCPYAIRARLAIFASGVDVEFHEVALRNKPRALLACSPKGTVPVLQCGDDSVLEESLDIMLWALRHNDPHDWLQGRPELTADAQMLLAENDGPFKQHLDRYKYADRYPQQSPAAYRALGESFLMQLEARLNRQTYLCGARISLADMAIAPFIRQFARVDSAWFYASPYLRLIDWLTEITNSELFVAVMRKS